jgi:hypothetical protein
MKLLYALLTAALFTTAACGKKKDEPAKTDPAAKTTDPAKTDPAKTAPATPDPAKADPAKADPAKAEPAKTEPAKTDTGKPGSAYTVDEAGAHSLALGDKIAKAIEDAGGDCAKMAANLKVLTDEVKAASALEKDFNKDAAKKAEFDKKYEPQLEAKMAEPVKKLQKCMSNPDVKAFVETMAAD